MALGLALSLDLGLPNLAETGFGISLLLLLLYFLSIGCLYFPTSLMSRNISFGRMWEFGMFGILEFGAVFILLIPLCQQFSDKFSFLSLPAEGELKAGIFLTIFSTLMLAALAVSFPPQPRKPIPGDITPSVRAWRFPLTKAGIILFTLCFGALVYQVLPTHQKHFLWASLYGELGARRSAREECEKALVLSPQFAPALHLRGLLLLTKEIGVKPSYGAALEDLKHAQTLEPKNPRFLLTLSLAYSLAGNMDEAIQTASQAASLFPRDAQIRATLADLFQQARRPKQALEAYRQAMQIQPSDPRLLNNMAFTMLEHRMEVENALSLARESVRLLPETSFNLDTLGWAYYLNHMYPEAFETISQARALASGSTEIEFHYTLIASKLGIIASPTPRLISLADAAGKTSNLDLQSKIVDAIASLTTKGTPVQTEDIPVNSFSAPVASEATASTANSPEGLFPTSEVFLSPASVTTASEAKP